MEGQNKTAELLTQLGECFDILETRLRVYDKALRFAEANYPAEANIFKFCIETVQTPGLPDFASSEHQALVQATSERASRILQDLSNLPKPAK
jgi:hypothetical protein